MAFAWGPYGPQALEHILAYTRRLDIYMYLHVQVCIYFHSVCIFIYIHTRLNVHSRRNHSRYRISTEDYIQARTISAANEWEMR